LNKGYGQLISSISLIRQAVETAARHLPLPLWIAIETWNF
jgi:hypothetical protein